MSAAALSALDRQPDGGLSGRVVTWCLEQHERVQVDPLGDALQALEGQVALAPLNAAHVGAVDT